MTTKKTPEDEPRGSMIRIANSYFISTIFFDSM